jgi:hypothetical protein
MMVKYPAPRSPRWAVWEWADIPSNEDRELVYLRRLRVVTTPWFSVMLHWINEPDSDRHPHCHPWNFWSLVLRGGYTEVNYVTSFSRPAVRDDLAERNSWPRWSLHRMTTRRAHRITSVQPRTVTLVVTGRRVREWGFWTEQGFIPWRQYTNTDDVS